MIMKFKDRSFVTLAPTISQGRLCADKSQFAQDKSLCNTQKDDDVFLHQKCVPVNL